MKAGISILLLLFSIHCMGQSRHLMNQISSDINRELEGGELRNSRFQFHFEKKDGDIVYISVKDIPYHNIKTIISRYADSIEMGRVYRVSIYHDLYSSKVYASTDTAIRYEGFPNFDNYLSYPRARNYSFQENVYSELRKHRAEIDTLTWSDWREPIYLFIDPYKSHEIIKSNKLVKHLDSSLRIPWSKPMYHAKPINVIAEIRLDKNFLDADRSILVRLHQPIQVSYVLPQQYENQWVRFATRRPEHPGDIMVSFVFNPITLKVENAVILNGEQEEASRLSDWIRELDLPERMFYWPGTPYTYRMYFFIDAD